MAGKPVHVHTSHNTVDCKPLYTALLAIYIDHKDDKEEEESDQLDAGRSGQADKGHQNS